MNDKEKFEKEALAEFLEMTGIPKERIYYYSRVYRVEYEAYDETYELKNPGLAVIMDGNSPCDRCPVLYFPRKPHDISEPVLSHSETSGLIYVYFGGEKYEITKYAIEAVEAIKALEQKPKCAVDCQRGEQMDFPNTFDEFAKNYGFKDSKEIYTNGSELIPVFRVKQWLKYISSSVTPQEPILDKIRAEIKEWYWQADKQALVTDPCVVDAMIDLFIQTINKYSMNNHWIDDADRYRCPICGFETGNPANYEGCKCPKCGFQDEKDRRNDILNKRFGIPMEKMNRKGCWIPGKELCKEYQGQKLVHITYKDWHCSNCNKVIEQSEKPEWNFCPYCGSDNR